MEDLGDDMTAGVASSQLSKRTAGSKLVLRFAVPQQPHQRFDETRSTHLICLAAT